MGVEKDENLIDLITTLFMREQSGRKECFFMPKFKATAYIRLSYTDDRSSESDSVSNQRKLIENFVERNPDIEVVSEKIDDGYSGIIFDRPAFKEMMQDITDGNINCVIVKDLSRLGREYIETGRYLRRVFPAYGVRFIAITDNIDTAHDSSGDDLTVSVKNIMNEAYCRDISIKTRTSLDVKRRNGDFVGAFTVYGYMKSEDNKNQLVPDPYLPCVVRDIFRMRLEGASASKIAAELNRLGILSPLAYKKNNGLPYAKKGYADKADCKWSATTIIRILQDETYTGTLVQGKQGTPHYKIKQMEQRPASEWVRVTEAHEPLIARQDFDLVQRIKGLDTRTSPKEDTVYLFSGILICGCCGSRMTRKTNRTGGKEYHYYYCPTGKKKGCTHPVMLKESSLIACVRDSLKAYIDNVASLETLLSDIDQASINQALAKEYSDHITDNERRLEQVLEFKARLYESLVGGMLTKEEYASYKAKYSRQAEDIKESIRVLKDKLTDVMENRSERNRWISQFTQFSTLETLDRRALIHMVQSIRVMGKKELAIAFTYEDEYKKALQLIKLAAQSQQTEEFEHRKVG
jgi:DNA invertase Pin-like site-specific DNA recombinase